MTKKKDTIRDLVDATWPSAPIDLLYQQWAERINPNHGAPRPILLVRLALLNFPTTEVTP